VIHIERNPFLAYVIKMKEGLTNHQSLCLSLFSDCHQSIVLLHLRAASRCESSPNTRLGSDGLHNLASRHGYIRRVLLYIKLKRR
jgi:hypothetical protein